MSSSSSSSHTHDENLSSSSSHDNKIFFSKKSSIYRRVKKKIDLNPSINGRFSNSVSTSSSSEIDPFHHSFGPKTSTYQIHDPFSPMTPSSGRVSPTFPHSPDKEDINEDINEDIKEHDKDDSGKLGEVVLDFSIDNPAEILDSAEILEGLMDSPCNNSSKIL